MTQKYWTFTLKYWNLTPKYWNLTQKYWNLTTKYWNLTPKYWNLTPKYWNLTPNFEIWPDNIEFYRNLIPKLYVLPKFIFLSWFNLKFQDWNLTAYILANDLKFHEVRSHRKLLTLNKVWSFLGRRLRKETSLSKLVQFVWRPRMPTLLTEKDLKMLKKDMKTYTREFENTDRSFNLNQNKEEVARRREILTRHTKWHQRRLEQINASAAIATRKGNYLQEIPSSRKFRLIRNQSTRKLRLIGNSVQYDIPSNRKFHLIINSV